MSDIDYAWLYPKLGDLGEATSAFLNYLILSLGSVEQEALENLAKMSVEELEEVINKGIRTWGRLKY
jgi:hypothetical protein